MRKCILGSLHEFHQQQLPGMRGKREVVLEGYMKCVSDCLFMFLFVGGKCLPALGCLMETQVGDVAFPAGPWVCVTT